METTANTLQINDISIDATGTEYAGKIVIETEVDQIVFGRPESRSRGRYVARTYRESVRRTRCSVCGETTDQACYSDVCPL